MPDPAELGRRILLAVVGLTPQVVTETLYALVCRRDPPFLPTALHLITTAEGAERIRLQLLDPEAGAFAAFAADFAPALSRVLAATTVDVLRDGDGRPLDDVTSAEDGMRAADRIAEVVRAATADPGTAVWASIAGGRKTMGFLLGYALSLYGRPQDRLSHVLVNAPFQDHPAFFYPPPKPRILYVPPGNRPVRTDAAHIVLTDIPFVRLRSGLPDRLLQGRASFAETVAEAQEALAPARLVIDPSRRLLLCRDRSLRLPPVEFAFFLWLARRRLQGAPEGGAIHWREADVNEYLEVYASLPDAAAGHRGRVRKAIAAGITKEWFEQRVTRINKLVNAALGLLAGPYQIVPRGGRPLTRYGLSPLLESIIIPSEPTDGQ
ncbi:MAG: TIGR02584 family CRISPR-associated protein [Rhodospirillaceae bacterium]|nr:TIGR02584 family CRISPR-associated protein [Rhodospirillaceae bacterium]